MRLNVIFQESEKEIALDFKELNERVLIEFEGTQVVTEPDDLVKKLFARTGEIYSTYPTEIPRNMFSYSDFETANFPNAETVGESAFSRSENLKSVILPKVKEIERDAFNNCINLVDVQFPVVETLSFSVFSNCENLRVLEFPKVLSFLTSCFSYCENLLSVKAPQLTSIGNSAFYECSNLLVADLGESSIIQSVFSKAYRVSALIFRRDSKVSLNASYLPDLIKAKNAYGEQGYIYVPKSLIESYQSNYSSYKFRAIEDFPQIVIHRWKRFSPSTYYVFSKWGTTESVLNKSSTATTNVYTDCEFDASTGKMIGVGSYSAKTASAIRSGMASGTTYYYRYSSTDVRKIVSVDNYTGTSTSYKYTIKHVSPQTTEKKNWDDLTDETICVAHDPTYFPDKGKYGTYYYEKLDEYTFDVN